MPTTEPYSAFRRRMIRELKILHPTFYQNMKRNSYSKDEMIKEVRTHFRNLYYEIVDRANLSYPHSKY